MPYDALCRGRHSLRNQIYCVTTVILNRRPLFTEFATARLLVREIRRLHDEDDVLSLAWVVMPDHLHWMFQLRHSSNEFDPTALSWVVKALKARSALNINRHLCQSGSLWQRAHFDRAARKDEDIRHIARYIVANPLRAGLVRDIGHYPPLGLHWDERAGWGSGRMIPKGHTDSTLR